MYKKPILNFLKHNLFIFLAIILFVSLAILNITHVQTIDDEIDPALFSLQFQYNSSIDVYGDSINISGIELPLNFIQPYCFALVDYMLLIFFSFFGTSLITLRLLPISAVALSLIFLYKDLILIFNRNTAKITITLLITSPLFIKFSMLGIYTTEPFLNLFLWAAVFFFIKHKKDNGSYLYLNIAAFFIGLGLSLKISVFSRFIGLFLAYLLIFNSKAIQYLKIYFKRKYILTVLIFCVGASLFITFNIRNNVPTLKLIKKLYTTPKDGETDNKDFMNNLDIRIKHFNTFLLGINNPENISKKTSLLLLYVFYFSIIFNLFYNLYLEQKPEQKKAVFFIYILYFSMFFTTCFSPLTMRLFHLIILYPFPQLSIGLSALNMTKIFNRCTNKNPNPTITFLPKLILLFFICLNLFTIYKEHLNIKHQNIINEYEQMIKYISDYKLKPVFFLADTMQNALILSSQAQIIPPKIGRRLYFSSKEDFIKKIETIFQMYSKTYFIYTKRFELLNWLQEYSEENKIHWKAIQIFNFNSNDDNIEIYAFEKIKNSTSKN